ncbi:hypothetical protein [Cupriavidus basilensis]|uniref:hypothetical protein n=1 Tax=Cupriavidus basilensis TaxID=68895 RepID=UPI00157BB105|nr:hypothetical protein [Cupriavidus basilensis]
MHRLTLFAVSLALAMPALATELGADVRPASPAADKVYPPLPTLAMLPPASGSDELSAPRVGHTARARIKALPAQERKSLAPVVRLVVSDSSRAYLDTIGRQLDQALQQSSPPGPVEDHRQRLASEGTNRVR